MSVNETNSAANSGTTSTSAPAKSDSSVKKPAITEAQFLTNEADQAKAAMQKAVEDLKHSLAGNVDVRVWTKQYPWIATAAAVAAGVAAGYTITPRNKDEVMEMWAHLKEHFTAAEGAGVDAAKKARHSAEDAAKPSMLGSILREALKVAGPILASLASGAVSGAAAGSGNGHEGNGASSAGSTPSDNVNPT